MGRALYRKYRSKSLNEIVGQEHITTTLQHALKQGTISHAYLFTGPRGVGKTSIARILAHEVNGLPYGDERMHLDIVEIDAASNRRIEEIRDLRDKVQIAPTSAKFKVYIIDEVHMLTKEAFNALLKTLEEPPEHVIFILATTEIHKVPETIISRTQRFTFKPIEADQAVDHLKMIAKQEGIKINNEALQLIAAHSGGSFRDSISLLDQVRAGHTKIELTDVEAVLGIAPSAAVDQLLESVTNGASPKTIHAQLTKLYEQGITPSQLAKQLQQLLRQSLIHSATAENSVATARFLKQLLAVPSATVPEDWLLITLIEAATTADQGAQLNPTPKSEPKAAVSTKQVSAKQEPKPNPARAKVIDTIQSAPTKNVAALANFNDVWDQSLLAIKQKYNTLYGILRMAQPELDGQTLTLKFAFPFHQKRIEEAKNRQIIIDILAQETGQTLTVITMVDKAATPKPAEPVDMELVTNRTAIDQNLQNINDIFGDAEVLES